LTHGWNKKAYDELVGYMEAMKIELVADRLEQNYVPFDSELVSACELGRQVGEELVKRVDG